MKSVKKYLIIASLVGGVAYLVKEIVTAVALSSQGAFEVHEVNEPDEA